MLDRKQLIAEMKSAYAEAKGVPDLWMGAALDAAEKRIRADEQKKTKAMRLKKKAAPLLYNALELVYAGTVSEGPDGTVRIHLPLSSFRAIEAALMAAKGEEL